jgi:hypothetical protein
MTQLTKRLATVLAAIVLGTTLLASGANAAVPTSDPGWVAVVPSDAHLTTVDGDRTDRDGEHHRRFCAKLNAVLTRLVEKNVITGEQKLRIMEAFDCVSKPTTKPTTTEPRSTRPAPAQ